jgi:uncharacterized protein
MNAYELANDLEGWSDDWLSSGNKKNVFKKHAKMLRHQADYIKHLERGLESSIALNKAQLERLTNLSKNVDELEEELLKTPQIKKLSDEEIEKIRVVIMEAAYWCAENGDSESYNAVKVMCSKVLAMLRGEK